MKRYERIMQQHPEIQSWLENRPLNTQKAFSQRLMDFCRAMQIAPRARHMGRRRFMLFTKAEYVRVLDEDITLQV